MVSDRVSVLYLLLTRRDASGETTDDELSVLRRRYAERDIDEEEEFPV